jgi:Zn-dependent protease with chaperone function
MDFFARQDQARRKTKWLVVYFALAVISMIVMIYGVALLGSFYLNLKQEHQHYVAQAQLEIWNAKLFGAIALGTLAVIIVGSAWKTAELSAGGSAVAESLGGRLIDTNTTNLDERKLLNVVEEMAIASGVPMPLVYVLEDEDGINAFAAGHTTSDAAIGVTRNCMSKLTRDELQGVIGHEFSHILNGDMRLNLRLIGILFGIFCIATIGRILLNTRSGNSRDKNPLPLLGILLLIIGSLGLFFGRLIQAAVSRQREFLADASSVQFTRNPAGLSGALQKVGGYGSRMWSPHAPDAGHLFFGNAVTESFTGLLATHPPLEYRIKAIDPTWDGKFQRLPDDKSENLHLSRGPQSSRATETDVKNLFGSALGTTIAVGGMEEPHAVRPQNVVSVLGNPTPLHLKYAEELRDALPESLKAAARDPLAATALVYALILSGDEKLRAQQIAEIAKRVSPVVSERTAALFPEVSQTARRARLPLVNLALGALRNLAPRDYAQFSGALEWLVGSDGQVELFEFVLQKIIRHHLAPRFAPSRPPAVQYYTLKPLVPDCAAILSALAHVGAVLPAQRAAGIVSAEPFKIAEESFVGGAPASQRDVAQNAFDTGAPYLRAPANMPLELLPLEQCGVDVIGAALDRLALAAPIIKKNLLDACARVVGADGVILEAEAEVLRAVADTLDCPIPPLGVTD